jgi:hypothetical protein
MHHIYPESLVRGRIFIFIYSSLELENMEINLGTTFTRFVDVKALIFDPTHLNFT